MSITGTLPTDAQNYRFAGPGGYLPAGTRVGSTDYALTHALLYAADGTTVLIGQKAMASSIPVVVASDQSAISVTSAKAPLTPSVPTFATVGTSSTSIVSSNGARKGLIICNTSTSATVSLSLNGDAVLGSGITLPPGASWTMGEYDFATNAVVGIASSAGTNVGVQEFT